ncbi:MAG: polymer-forming cytoskeletal protein [Proteobacteria bacterium]|nr:polymer-forming cytoskeletal protein [Pseudomonadota bacterium]
MRKMKNANSNSVETSIIAKDTTIKGNLEFVGTLIVEGTLESQVKGIEMTIQKNGKINGSLNVRTLNCHGQIEGDITAESVVIHSSAHVSGEIKATTLEIEPGATINGNISMKTPKSASVQQLSDKLAGNKS